MKFKDDFKTQASIAWALKHAMVLYPGYQKLLEARLPTMSDKGQAESLRIKLRILLEMLGETPPAPPRSAEEILEKYICRVGVNTWVEVWDAIKAMHAYASQFRNELDEVKDERETMIRAFCEIREEFESRTWLMEGRGSYPFNDDRYKQEVRCIMDAFNDIEKKMWKQIKSKTHEYRNEIQREFRREVTDEEIAREAQHRWKTSQTDPITELEDMAKWTREKMTGK